jgi:hypothetical protein
LIDLWPEGWVVFLWIFDSLLGIQGETQIFDAAFPKYFDLLETLFKRDVIFDFLFIWGCLLRQLGGWTLFIFYRCVIERIIVGNTLGYDRLFADNFLLLFHFL